MQPELDVSTLPKKEKDAALKLIASAYSNFSTCVEHRIVWRNSVEVRAKMTKHGRVGNSVWLRIELSHKHGAYFQIKMFRREDKPYAKDICLGSKSVTDTRANLFKIATASHVNLPIYQRENPSSCHSYQSSNLLV